MDVSRQISALEDKAKELAKELVFEQAVSLFKHKETPCANELFLYNLFLHNNIKLHGKRAKTVCDVVKSMFGRKVTERQVRVARKEVLQERRHMRMMEALVGSLSSDS